METGARNAVSIKLKRTISANRTGVEKIDAEMGISRLLPDTVPCEKECLNSETKPRDVTSIRDNTSRSPYLRVTGQWTVRNKPRRYPLGVILWFALFIFLLTMNACFFGKLQKQYKECLQTVTRLESIVKQLEEETQDLQEKLDDLRQNNIPSTHPSLYSPHPGSDLSDSEAGQSINSLGELIRKKRSNEELRSDRRERKKKTVAVQFSGSRPYGFYMVPPEGILGPWIESTNDNSNVEKFGAKLRDHDSTLEINRDGTYMIYAQVTYQSINVSNSYSINVIPNTDRLLSQPITTCSSFGKIVRDGEISCYTSVVKLLNAGDIVFVQQAQPDREIIFTKTYTYFGLIYLN